MQLNEDDNRLKRFLLGNVTSEEEAQLEDRLFDESDFVRQLAVVEEELIDDYLCGRLTDDERVRFESHFMARRQAPGQSDKADVRREQLLTIKALKRYAANSTRGSDVRIGENRPDFGHWMRAFFTRWWSAPVFAALLLVAGFGIWRAFFYKSPLDEGLAALSRAYRDRRLIEARITGFDYAKLTKERGETIDPVVQDELEESLALLRKAARTRADAESFHALGKFYLARGDFDQSAAQFKTALKLAPDTAAIHSDLSAALLLKIKSEAAAQGSGLSPQTVDEAFLHVNKALELKADLLEALFNRGLLYETLNLDEPARNSWETYLTKDNHSRWADEARKKLEALRKKKSETGIERSEHLYNELLSAYRNGEDEKTWQAYNDSYLRHGNYVADRLIDGFLALSSEGRETDAEESLRTLERLGRLSERKARDSYLTDLAAAYRGAAEWRRRLLSEGRKLRRSAYDLSIENRHQQAIEACLAAINLFARASAPVESLTAEFWIAECYLRQSGNRKSLPAFTSVAAECERRQYRWLRALTFNRLAAVLGDRFEYSEAMRYCSAAAAEFSRIGDQSGYLRTLINQSSLFGYLGKHREAVNGCQASLALAKHVAGADDGWISVLYAISGSSFYRLSLFSAALEFQKEAVRVVERLNYRQSISRYSVETGLIYSKLKDFDAAIACVGRGLEIARHEGQSPTGLDMLNFARLRLAQVYREMGKYTEALNELDQASEFYREGEWKAQSYLIAKEVLLNRLAMGDISSGRRQLDMVLELLEKHRTKILQQSIRNSFFDSEQGVYDIAIDFAYTSLGQTELAFNYSELSRARSLLDSATVARQITIEFNLPEESLSDSTRPFKLAELQPRIPSEVQILQYAVLEDRTIAWVITRDKIVSRSIDRDPGDLQDKIKAYLDQLSNSREIEREWRRSSDDLYKILISPVEPLLDKQRLLCIVPDKILNFLPFGSLRSPQTERHLIEDYALLTAPSSTLFIRGTKNAERKARTNRERLLSVGNPAFNPAVFKLPDLASASREAEAIAPLYDEAVTFVGKNAKKAALLSEIEGADVVHLAMHYLPDQRSPMLSKLIMADAGAGAEAENTMSMFEVYKLKLTKARLVVLSACRTRAEEFYNGEGVIGLSRPFEAAGVPLVISSLWPVDSDETEKLMINFHTLRRKTGLPTVNALREAQIAMLRGADERLRHPYYWAAFIASGGYSRF